jgi:hypothetical protein
MSDIMDEFEFKPLTDGLGFHKKPQDGSTAKSSSPSQLDAMFGNPSKSRIPDISTPLPRNSKVIAAEPTELPTTTVDEILKTLQEKKRPTAQFSSQVSSQTKIGQSKAINAINAINATDVKTRIDATPEPIKFQPAIWNFSAFVLDFMLILASNLLCLIILLVTTKVDLFANLYNPDAAGMIYFSLAALFFGTTWIYLVVNRIFLGATPGEWVFDQRLGFPHETESASYSLKIALRTSLILLSGVILFPLLSLAFGRDILGHWLGIQMMKKA